MVYVKKGLCNEIFLMLKLKLKHIKFIVQPEKHIDETSFTDQSIQQNKPNIFNRL